MSPTNPDAMSADEKRAGISLAAIFALRMLGLFLILPVFSIYAKDLPGGNDMAMVGFALGAYGLTQACLQIAYGSASDRFGRKPVIVFGLVLFVIGSFVAAMAGDIYGIIIGRVLQGAGAISAAVTALAADLTREQHRTKVMAMIGSSIGLVFALSMVGAPLLYATIGMPGIFALTGILALIAIFVVLKVVPAAPAIPRQPGWPSFVEVLTHPQLLRMNFGVFALHLMQTAMWVLVPSALVSTGALPVAEHWKIYLPAVLLSFVFMVPAIIAAEKHGKMKLVFNAAIALLVAVQLGFGFFGQGAYALAFWMTLFFIAFNVLEATQPSLISRIAPPHAKGAALGVYNTTQSLGLFLGGVLGGALAKFAGAEAVWLACAAVAVVWLLLGVTMTMPPPRVKPASAKPL
jgi:MFS family permease